MTLLWLVVAGADPGPGIEVTRHNLSVTGPGPVRSVEQTEVCVFCHATHVPDAVTPLWNHQTSPGVGYRPYASPLLGADAGAVNGASRLCLSCHDGTIAVGAVRARDGSFRIEPVERTDGGGRLRAGTPANLGTDLSGSHPVSIAYREAARRRSPASRTWLHESPADLGVALLDATGSVQCTSCHDPHQDPAATGAPVPPFWKGDTFSEVCTSCHEAPVADRGHEDPTLMLAECGSCHVGHGAPGQALLPEVEEDNCFDCHGGAAQRREAVEDGRLAGRAEPVRVDDLFTRPYTHPVGASEGAHRPDERDRLSTARTARHVECADCHPVHAYRGVDRPEWLPTRAGAAALDGRPEQELCFDCHGPSADLPYGATDKVREFDPANESFHPVAGPARGRSPSLRPGVPDAITCSDCHGPDGGDPRRGPHGSRNPYLLRGAYTVRDGADDTSETYAACYGCHERERVLSDDTFAGHRQHVVSARISCYTCHDSHGSPDAPGLVRFNKDARNGSVAPSASGRLEYDPEARTCRLSCHGVDHDPLGYP
ncbi:MAG: cytochrome c3 family protein [Myxococcota bacterium]